VGRFVHQDDTIGISFQGKTLELKVKAVEMKPTETLDELSSGLSSIDIDPATTPETEIIENALRRSLQVDDASQNRIRLYKLTYETEIVLVHDNTKCSHRTDAQRESKYDVSRRVVAGLDTTLDQVKSLLLPPLMRPELFRNHSLRPPRGVLLHGPSGCGKSLLAHQVKLDLESDIRVRAINCTSLQSRTAIVGEAERHLTRIFQSFDKNHEASGTLLILDDIHLICSKRGGTNLGADRLAATLLALLDGIGASAHDKERGNLVILGITSNPSLLDPALRRPGRLDSEVEVPIPDEVTRAEIIKFQLEHLGPDVSMPQWTETDFMSFSRLAKGFNGADVMLAIKEALRKTVLSYSSGAGDSTMISLTQSHLEASIRATKPSTISSITVEIPQVHWTSIGGMDDVKQKLRESIELPITHAHLFQALNISPPRGVLLYGPPGCSKTLMARALATEGRMNFLAVKGPELLSKWLGESERALASLFKRARMASPCIIFFDEIDAIASKRGEGSAGGERLLSQLLTELDGIGSSSAKPERVIVVGATNRPDLLDTALTRPGRIDRMIYVGLPDETSRAHILEIGLKDKACSSDVEVGCIKTVVSLDGFAYDLMWVSSLCHRFPSWLAKK
jgi:transitional endoplasmic reticulum ATPase/AAA family ATPase